MRARAATRTDLDRVAALLAAAGFLVDRASLERRIESELDAGIVLGESATISWALDGAALHVYDIAGASDETSELLDFISTIARQQLAVVLAATLHEGDPRAALLEACAFTRDWEEPDVIDGRVRTLVGYVRVTD